MRNRQFGRRRPLLGPDHGSALAPSARRPVLVDRVADSRLRRDGFVKVPWPHESLIDDLTEQYGRIHGWEGTGFEPDLINPDLDYRRRASGELATAVDGPVRAAFHDHVPFLRNFLCKWPDEHSALNLHRDWMYIDERLGGRTYVVWVPLVDVDEGNGPVQVLRHSHRVDRSLRGTGLNAAWVEDDAVRERLLSVPVRRGEALVFDNALVHCSPPNRTSAPRVVVAVAVRPAAAPLVHFRTGEDGLVQRFDVDEDFFLSTTPSSLVAAPPPLGVAEEIRPGAPCLTADVVVQHLGSSLLTRVDDLRRGWQRLRPSRRRTAREFGPDHDR